MMAFINKDKKPELGPQAGAKLSGVNCRETMLEIYSSFIPIHLAENIGFRSPNREVARQTRFPFNLVERAFGLGQTEDKELSSKRKQPPSLKM